MAVAGREIVADCVKRSISSRTKKKITQMDKKDRKKTVQTIKTKDGQILQVQVPEDVSDRTLRALADMMDASNKLPSRPPSPNVEEDTDAEDTDAEDNNATSNS